MTGLKINIMVKIFLILITSLFSFQTLADNKIIAVTENYPPYNMINNNKKIIGVSTEIMEELFKRAQIEYSLNIFPWTHSYKLALEEKNTVVYATSRTPERENLFKWVGPIGESNWVFFAKKDSKIKIKNLEDAKKYRVGGYYEDATADYLKKNGFISGKSLFLATNEVQNAFKLEAGRIDLWATGSLLGPWISKFEKTGDIIALYTFKKSELYAAFNKKTDDSLIKNLNAILEKMRKEKVIDNINKKYR